MLFIIESIGASTIRMGTIYMIAALGGGNLAEKSGGLLNLTIEGNMLISAFFAATVSYYTGSALYGVLAALVVGGPVCSLLRLYCDHR